MRLDTRGMRFLFPAPHRRALRSALSALFVVFAGSAPAAEDADVIYLDTLTPLEDFVNFFSLRTNQNKKEGDTVEVDEKPASHYLLAHANSRLLYKVPPGASRFQAYGVATTRFRRNSSWFYEVRADGVLLFRSQPLNTYEKRQVRIDVELPADAKNLMLVVDNQGNSAEDHSVWAEPCFVFGSGLGPASEKTAGANRGLVAKLPAAQLDGVVLVEGDQSVGTGFFALIRDQPFVVTNQHVIAGNKSVKISSRTGLSPAITGYILAKDRDLALLRIDADPATLPVLKIAEAATSTPVGEELLAAGNSEGGGTILQSEGRIVGFGNDRIEHDIATVSGNSGSPLFSQKTWEVLAMDTFYRVRRASRVTDPASRNNARTSLGDIRHFGVRIDTAKEWSAIDWDDWQKECAQIAALEYRLEGLEKLLIDERKVWITYPDIALKVQAFETRTRGMSAGSPNFNDEATSLFQTLLNYAQQQERTANQLKDRNFGHLRQKAENLAAYAGQLEAALKAWNINVADRLKAEAR